jgi:hypothetical protein
VHKQHDIIVILFGTKCESTSTHQSPDLAALFSSPTSDHLGISTKSTQPHVQEGTMKRLLKAQRGHGLQLLLNASARPGLLTLFFQQTRAFGLE